jgi:hypothetical protein
LTSGLPVAKWDDQSPGFLPFLRKRTTLEIDCDLLESNGGRAEQSIALGAAVRLIFHDEGVLLTEIRVPKMHCCYSHALEPKVASQV